MQTLGLTLETLHKLSDGLADDLAVSRATVPLLPGRVRAWRGQR